MRRKAISLQLIAATTTLAFCALLLTPAWAEEPDPLPPDPGAQEIPKADSWAYGTVGPEDLPDGDEPYEDDVVCLQVTLDAPKLRVEGLLMLNGGILMSEQKALRCADYKVAYVELRALYALDLKGWALKEKVYLEQLGKADEEIEKLDGRLNGTWNRYKFAIGMGIGFLLSTILAICTTVIVVKLK